MQVNSGRLLSHLQALVGERHPFLSPDRLAQTQRYLVEQFTSFGLQVSLDELSYMGKRFVNVVAHSCADPGRARLIIGAHFDTVPGTPGADDNASGVAALLETARTASEAWGPGAPLEFVGFNLEELGMVGACHYAASLKRRKVPLIGMLSLEMLGFTESQGLQQYPPLLKRFYPREGNFIGLAANRRSRALLKTVERAMRAVPSLPVETLLVPANGWLVPESRLSDHSPFWDAGYPALLITDTAFLRNPHYHQASDTLKTLDMGFLARVCQGLLEAIRALIGPPADRTKPPVSFSREVCDDGEDGGSAG